MPTGLRNVVCDECHGGRIIYLPTGEVQLEHKINCPYKYREDTFLIELVQGLNDNHKKKKPFTIARYPKVKLNPIIYDLMCNNVITEERANKLNKTFQLVREAMIKDGTWPYLHTAWMECPAI